MTAQDKTKTLSNAWVVLILLLGIGIFNHADRALMVGLVDPIKAEFGVDDGFMGLLMGPAFAVFYSLFAIPIAIYADRASRIRIIVAGCILWSVFTMLCGFATGPWSLAAARVGVGIGEAAFQAPAYSLVAAYFMTDQRGKAFAIMALAVYFGQMLGLGVGPAIAETADWRLPFKLFGFAGLVVILLAWLFIKEPPRSGEVYVGDPSRSLSESFVGQFKHLTAVFSRLVKLISYRNMAFGMGLGVMSGIAFGNWGPTLFSRNYAMTMSEAGAAFGSAFVIPALVGTMAFGFLFDRVAKKGYGRCLALSAIALIAATASVLGATWAGSLEIALLWAIPAGLFGGGWAVGIYAGLQYVLPDNLRATGTALAMLAVNLLGYVLGPWAVGELSVSFGEGSVGLQQALTVILPIGFIGAFMLWRGSLKLERDRADLYGKATDWR
ncbi:MAG: MFS transporter [Pontixanthobacter sp.]